MSSATLHRLAITSALLISLWGMRATLPGGVALHFLGAGLLYLMYGPRLALCALGVVACGTDLLLGRFGTGTAWIWVADGALPLAVVWALHAGLRRVSPANPFLYVFGVAFAGGWASMLASLLLHAWRDGGVAPVLALGMMLGFGEAFLTGMLVTVFVVYRRTWMATFDDARWLGRR